jgi:hypothetical protein
VQALVEDLKTKVIQEHDAQVSQSLGEAPITALDTSAETDRSGLGYVAAIENAAREAGLSEREARAMGTATREEAFALAEQTGYIEDAQAAEDAVQGLIEGAAQAREMDKPYRDLGAHKLNVPTVLDDPENAKEILLAHQEWKLKQTEINRARREMGQVEDADEALEIAQGVTMAVSRDLQRDEVDSLEQQLNSDLQQMALRQASEKLLGDIDAAGEKGVVAAENMVATGRYNALNETMQTVLHDACPVDRRLVGHRCCRAARSLCLTTAARRLTA